MSTSYRRGLVPLSADPITYGHIDLITRAAACCDDVVAFIGHNDLKSGSYLFTLPERIAMTVRAVAHLPNVRVQACDSLLVDIFIREGCDCVFRGIRNETDRVYEAQQLRYNDMILPGFASHTIYLSAASEFTDISSSAVKAFVSHHVDVSRFVPLCVKARLEEEICGYQLIGITGGIASGKSYVAAELATRLDGIHLNFDHLLRKLYVEQSRGAQRVRDSLAQWLGPEVLKNEGREVNRTVLAGRMFDPQCPDQLRQQVEALTTPHVFRLYREQLAHARGVVIVEWAQLAQMGLGHLVNNKVVIVDSPDREQLLTKRGISSEAFCRIAAHQWSTHKQVAHLETVVARDRFGSVTLYENRLDPEHSERGLGHLTQHVRTILGFKEIS
jgi:pantetheine-phosphate adenylyltransferase